MTEEYHQRSPIDDIKSFESVLQRPFNGVQLGQLANKFRVGFSLIMHN